MDNTGLSSSKSKRRRLQPDREIYNLKKYPLLPPCSVQCSKKCHEHFDYESRELIRRKFWSRDFTARREFMRATIAIQNVKAFRGSGIARRKNTLKYHFFSSSKTKISVCKAFYMSTLGMKTNGYITEFVKCQRKYPIISFRERRGGCRVFDADEERQNIIAHIDSYNPQISHYKRNHSPNRRYLNSELSIRDMWRSYLSQPGNRKVSYSLYQNVFRSLNIGFARPSQDECEICESYKNHNHSIGEEESSCHKCTYAKQHLENASLARHSYQRDRNKENPPNGHMSLAVDMQKVIMLPKTSLKSQYFVSRLTVFNETFCDLKGNGDYCLLWHEATSGRCASDLTSVFFKMVNILSDYTTFTIWCDNCCAQNKNWTLICGMWICTNLFGGPESVKIKYLEKGHTFMRPDAIHGAIGKKLKKSARVHDWNDLECLVQSSTKHIRVITLNYTDMYEFKDLHSKPAFASKLSTLKVIKVKKGSTKLFYKLRHDQPNYEESEFLLSKYRKADAKDLFPKQLQRPRGINKIKQQEITKRLIRHMSPRKARFWSQLPVCESVPDLVKERDEGEFNE